MAWLFFRFWLKSCAAVSGLMTCAYAFDVLRSQVNLCSQTHNIRLAPNEALCSVRSYPFVAQEMSIPLPRRGYPHTSSCLPANLG